MLTINCPRCHRNTIYPKQYPYAKQVLYRICTSCRVAGEKVNAESGLKAVAKIKQKYVQQGLLIKEE